MIKIENIWTGNWEAAIRGMRNPMNSWDKSDSKYCVYCDTINHCSDCVFSNTCEADDKDFYTRFIIGPNDHKLALNLVKSGPDHGKFLRSIIFSCDITAPMYWWKEMDTYKVSTTRNSCSTMHKIASKEFTIDDFSVEHLEKCAVENVLKSHIIRRMNYCRKKFLETNDKKWWWELIQLLPSSYNQRATWTANYEVLRNIYHARRKHKLDEWHDFCHMIEGLPYSELITEERKL